MVNKGTTFEQFKNSVITPKKVDLALENLPSNYIVQLQKVFEEQIASGHFSKKYSKQYIIEVKNRTAFNQDIMNVLVFIGLKNLDLEASYGIKKKKVPSTN